MEQYVYPNNFKVGDYGTAHVPVICNVNKSTKSISFHSYGQYTVSLNNGMSISMKSRTCKKSGSDLKLSCTFIGTNLNSHETSGNINCSSTITYAKIAKYYGWS